MDYYKVSLADPMVGLADPLMKTLIYDIILYSFTHYNSYTIIVTVTGKMGPNEEKFKIYFFCFIVTTIL